MKDWPSEAFPPAQDASGYFKISPSSVYEVALIFFPEIRIILPVGAERIMDTGTAERSHADLRYKAAAFTF